MSDFTLRDLEDILEPERFVHIDDALERATKCALWAGRPWLITDPAGRAAYSHRYPKDT
ncbi:hypothetical protein [Gordonia iterans]|uniref:hypothetical protein n=1 Tax=Gordonia iterans TaxID=1004901 RepID=UPI00131D2063|nr:hypothetical protein [Gordonia iterans]